MCIDMDLYGGHPTDGYTLIIMTKVKIHCNPEIALILSAILTI